MRIITKLLDALVGSRIVLSHARVFCPRDLPASWQPQPRTIIHAGVTL